MRVNEVLITLLGTVAIMATAAPHQSHDASNKAGAEVLHHTDERRSELVSGTEGVARSDRRRSDLVSGTEGVARSDRRRSDLVSGTEGVARSDKRDVQNINADDDARIAGLV
ncbi:hypothetical protein AnigIFM50267_010817 [Aspergillus niger]|nr:hypothetical protein AnigIFM50267_010817 [Aspergillus niger]